QFYDMVSGPSNALSINNHITINHNLSLVSGTFSTSTFNANAKGNVSNNAVHQSNNNSGGILLNGTTLQQLSGTGSFGRLELNNAAGARLMNDIGLSQNLLLTNGIFDINQYILVLGENCDIEGSQEARALLGFKREGLTVEEEAVIAGRKLEESSPDDGFSGAAVPM
ncbi:MAG TPA: hypothetical protein VKP30_07570, partial [Polyangiaceae bacterium]|nr:hypothetical protein [Polyangiaceae bacterium]